MKKRNLSLILAVIMVLSLFAGCGQQAEETPETDIPEPAPATEAPTETPEAEETEEPGTQDGIIYPLTEETYEVSWWLAFMSQFNQAIDSMSDYSSIKQAEELTNVHIEWQEVTYSAAVDQRQIIMASGEYPNIMGISQYYEGGQTAAIADGIIYDLAPYMEEYAPNMLEYYTSTDEIRRNFYNSDGTAGGFFQIRNEAAQVPNSAMAIRGDWLDELGMEVPTTYDELYDYMVACHDTFGADSALLMDKAMLFTQSIASGYDTKGYISNGRSFFQIDGVVDSGIASDNTKAFMQMYKKWYDEGLIVKDWMAISDAPGETDRWSYIFEGRSCVFMVAGNQVSLMEESGQINAPDFYVQAIPYLTVEKGGETHMADGSIFGPGGYTNITTSCEHPELVLGFLNYFWTDDGIMAVNLGVKGESWEEDGNGGWRYTNLLLNNEWGVDPATAVYAFTASDFIPSYYMGEKLTALYNEKTMDLLETWSSNTDGAYNLPANLTISYEDAADYSVKIAELETYAEQSLGLFLTGGMDLETQWDSYVATCKELGYDDCIGYWQSALDEYLAK